MKPPKPQSSARGWSIGLVRIDGRNGGRSDVRCSICDFGSKGQLQQLISERISRMDAEAHISARAN
jgi:hypothetical protein